MAENGFLTNTDRAFLRGEKEYETKQGRYDRRRAIAERARQAFHDFALLYEELDQHERDRIFDVGVVEDDGEVVEVDHDAVNAFHDSLIDTVAFLYLSLEGPLDSEPTARTLNVNFEQVLQAGVQKAESDRHPSNPLQYLINVDFDVAVSKAGQELPARAIKKIAEGRAYELSPTELQQLIVSMDPDATGPYAEGWGQLTDLVERLREADDPDKVLEVE